jgi:probable F420-dependent oxidoreductase
MKFGISIPTCVEGMAYPIRFADHNEVIALGVEAERLGYDSVLVNDHFSTMPYVREQFAEPPRFYEPLTTLGFLAARTERIRMMTGVVVMPMREPVLLAKQAATIDQLSNGRLTLGIGVGAYRAEFESVHPELAGAPRGELVAEGIEALTRLFGQRVADFAGTHYRFTNVEMYPKPVQDPFPLFSCGNAEGTIRRAAIWCAGWMPAGMPADRLAGGVARLRGYAAEAGRDGAAIEVAPQLVLCVDRDPERAMERFTASQAYEHLVSLRKSTLKGIELDSYTSQNLIGTPEQIVERIGRLAEAGATQLAGMIVVANTTEEMREQMKLFAAEVMPAFAAPATAGEGA